MINDYNLFVRTTSASFDVKVDIPSHIDINKSKFAVTCVAGQLDAPKVIHVHCSSLKSPYVFSSTSNKNDIIAIAALNELPSVTELTGKESLGMPLKVSHHCPCLRFYLTDNDYSELTGITFVEIQLCIYLDHSEDD